MCGSRWESFSEKVISNQIGSRENYRNRQTARAKIQLAFMKRTVRKTMILAVWACVLTTGQFAIAGEDWSFDVSPYLWVANVGIETSLPATSPSTSPTVDRFDTRISAGALLSAEARYRSVGLFVDFAWLQL